MIGVRTQVSRGLRVTGWNRRRVCLLLVGVLVGLGQVCHAATLTHPAIRPLPEPAPIDRPMPTGPTYFVDAERGNDENPGDKERPWRTVSHGAEQLKPGDTLLLRGGIYYENVTVDARGTADKPITIAGHPGELAIIDAGHREFLDDPGNAWEPYPEGGPGIYRSTRTYPDLAADVATTRGLRYVVGHFADTMNPLQSYKNHEDIQSEYHFMTSSPMRASPGYYLGPGFWVDIETEHIHVRLSHMSREAWGDMAYRGPTDPRQVPLVVGGVGRPLYLSSAEHVHVRDLVLRGTRNRVLDVNGCKHVVLDGLTIYPGGVITVDLRDTSHLTMTHTAVRGPSTPWSSRYTHKFRGSYPGMVNFRGVCADFEFAHCEFTDGYGGFRGVGDVQGVRFHHNLFDNFAYITLNLTTTRPHKPGLHFFKNRFSRCFSVFASSRDERRDETIAYIYRNVFDLRQPLFDTPREDSPTRPALRWGSVWHQSVEYNKNPIRKPMRIYQNTFLYPSTPQGRAYGGLTRGTGEGGSRALFNNMFIYMRGEPGLALLSVPADANLHWSYEPGMPLNQASLTSRVNPGPPARSGGGGGGGGGLELFGDDMDPSPVIAPPGRQASRGLPEGYPLVWGERDRLADPMFTVFDVTGGTQMDLRPRSDSPAVGAGMRLPKGWLDPFAPAAGGSPDIGAVPASLDEPWRVGVRGRYSVFDTHGSNAFVFDPTVTPSELEDDD